ncbi:MAG: PEP-CTERM sorting domain-containing protein, partial [Gemmatimonadota bacterium]
EFVFQGDYTNTSSLPAAMTFEYTGLEDIAAMFNGTLYALSLGNALFTLSNVNPDNPDVYQRAKITFFTPGATTFLTLDATGEPNTGGFTVAPEPSTIALTATGLAVLIGAASRRRSRLHLAGAFG